MTSQVSVVGGRDDTTATNLEIMGGQLHDLCKHEPDCISAMQSIMAKCPHAGMHRDSDGRTALHLLCANRPPLQSVAFLAANPMSCLQQTTKGMLALHYACRNQASAEVVEFLLGQCPETIRMANSSGWLSLHLACARGASLQVIEKLVNAWPESVRQTTNDGRMALHFACANHAPLEVVQLLVSHCREALSIQDQNEWAPLHIASAYSENIDVVTFLALECPEVLQSRGNLGRLPIHVACCEGQQLPIVEFLLNARPTTLLTRDLNGLLPLHCACLGSSGQPVIEYLIEQCPDSVLEIGLTVQEVARHVSRESGHTAPPPDLCQWLHRIQPALIYDVPLNETGTSNQTLPDIPTSRKNSVSPTENAPTPKTSDNDHAPVVPEGPDNRTQMQTMSDDEGYPQNGERSPTTRRPRRAKKGPGQQQQQQLLQQQEQAQPKKLPPDVVIAGQQLHKACEAPQSLNEIMQILAETPTAIEITTYGNALPIHTAALNQASSKILRFLFRLLPSSLLQADSEGNLPIHLACYSGASVEAIMVLAKECPESVTWKNLQGQTPLDKAKHPFLENPDPQVISYLENEMSNGATSAVGNDLPPQGALRPPVATLAGPPPSATKSIEPQLSQPLPLLSPTHSQVTVLVQNITSRHVNNSENKPKLHQPMEISLGNMPGSLHGPALPKPQGVTRSFTTPTGWARNVPDQGPHGGIPHMPPQFHAQGNFSHPSPSNVRGKLSVQPPQLSMDPFFRDGPLPRFPPSPNSSPLRGVGRSNMYAAPGTPSQRNRAPSPSPAQRKLPPSPAIIFGGRSNRSRSRSPSPSPMMRGIAGFFRRKGGNNSRNSSPARDTNESIPTADVTWVRDVNNNNSNNSAPNQVVGLPDAPFMNEITLPILQRNVNSVTYPETNLAAPSRPASISGSTQGCFSPDELSRLRGQGFQPFANGNNPPTSRGGTGGNQLSDTAMTMNANSSAIPKPAAPKPIHNNTTTARTFQRPMVVEAGTLTDRAFRPGAVAVNEPILRPDSALYRAVNTPRAPSPVTTRNMYHPQQQGGGTTTGVPQPYRPGFSNHLAGDDPDIVVMPREVDDYQVAMERSRQIERHLPPTTSGVEQDAMMEIIRMQEMSLMEGLRASNPPAVNDMRTTRQEDTLGPLPALSNPGGGEVVDRRLATIEAANIGSFYRSAIVSGDVAPIDLIPATPEEDEEDSVMHVTMTENAFGPPPRSPPSSFVDYPQQENSASSTTPPGAAGRVNRWAVMTGSPAGKPVSSFYRDAMRSAEEQSGLQRGANNRLVTANDVSGMGSRTMVSSFYRAAMLEATNQGGNHEGLFLAGIEE